MQQLQNAQLDKYNDKNSNMLMPTTDIQQIGPWHQLTVTAVTINPDPSGGEVFPVEKKPVKVTNPQTGKEWTEYVPAFSLGKVALMKIAQAGGITWHYQECRPLTVTKDYVLYQAVGAIRLPAGNWQIIPAKKEIDLTVIEDELFMGNLKKAQGMEPNKLNGLTVKEWAEIKTREAMIQWRKHKMGRAETGAMERVIRAALSMKHAYTLEELKKPFVIPRIDFAPDYNDPEVKRMILDNGIKSMNNMFQSTQASLPDMTNPANVFTVEPVEVEEEIDEVTPEEVESELAATASNVPPTPDNACHGCGQIITEKVAEFSVKKHGKPLCMTCQKKQ